MGKKKVTPPGSQLDNYYLHGSTTRLPHFNLGFMDALHVFSKKEFLELPRLVNPNHPSEDREWVTSEISDDELIRQYQAADVFVFPSLQEGFGIPLIEAMACGVPIVSTTATSIPDVVGDVGVLVEPARAEPFAKAILRILEDTALGQQLVRAGLTRSREHFDWNNVARRFVDLYRSLQMRKSMRRRADKEPS